jgi:hypothetical protein
MPQPLNLTGGGSGTLFVRRPTHTLLHGRVGNVVLEVPGQRSHPSVEVRVLDVRHGLKALLPYGVLLIPNQQKCDRQCCCSGEVVLAEGDEAMCAIISTLLSGSVPMTNPDHGSMGSKGIVTLTSHLSMP